MSNETLHTQKVALPVDSSPLTDPDIPKFYANGFSIGFSNADAQIVLMLYGRPFAVLSLSYTLTKTLSEGLADLVKAWETKTGQKLQTTSMIDKIFFADPKDGAQ